MHLARVAGENFRLFERFELAPGPRLNLILGPNASGKTSLLEAIYALGRGRSFRAASPEIAGAQGAHWWVHGRIAEAGAADHLLGIGWAPAGTQLRLDQADVGVLDLVRRLPVQVLEPESHRLLEDGPAYRRRYLDWGVFHVEQRFYEAWRRYQRALKQRNHSLKSAESRTEIESWNAELAAAGEEVHAHRVAHCAALCQSLGEAIGRLLGPVEWTLELAAGWPAHKTLADALADHLEQDVRQAKTLAGPHRAELRLKLAGRSAKRQVSRGQQKLLVGALLLTQASLVARHSGSAPILLVDDFPAELGRPYQAALLALLQDYPGQVFVTAIEATEALKARRESPVFHVEHGRVDGAKRV